MVKKNDPNTTLQGIVVYLSGQQDRFAWSPKFSGWLHALVPLLIASTVLTGLVSGMRSLGFLQWIELISFDQFVRLQPDEGPDPRLLVVTVTEEDIQTYKQVPLSDQIVEQALARLEQHQPRAIGLDIIRDIPIEPGHAALMKRLQTSNTIIPICKVGSTDSQGVASPPGVPSDFVGFADLVVDPDGVIRRNLMYLTPKGGKCAATNSFSSLLAISYLAAEGIQPQYTAEQYPQFGSVVFRPLHSDDGGYQTIDARGYQILLRYRSHQQVAKTISLADVLNNRFDPAWVKDRIVLIGYSDPSIKDTFATPYTAGEADRQPTPGIIVHAQIVSQILSAVLDGRTLFWFWPQWGEILWIWGWAAVGGVLALRIRHPLGLGVATTVAIGVLAGACLLGFSAAGWLPLVPAAIALMTTVGSLVVYVSQQAQQQQKRFQQQVQEQERSISLLQSILKESQAAPKDSKLAASPVRDLLNTRLAGRYHIRKVLGSGGFAQTFLAQDMQRPGSPVCVVKHLRPASSSPQFLQVARRLFQAEAEILEVLGQHNRIPQLLAYFEEEQEFYLVEEFVEGGGLHDELPPHKPLMEGAVVDLVAGILEVLAFIHRHRIIHRDIKPSNVIRRSRDRRLVLIDFGAVKQMQPQENTEPEMKTVIIGTPGYAPAEQLSGHPVLSSDVYAVGMIGIQALTGLSPKEMPRNTATGEFLWQLHAQVSQPFATILSRMVAYHFNDRYTSAIEALQDLERLPR
jgi:CHASE2 domain-containing sensor protein/predicted Ser/Thr protein kinase